VRNRTFAAACVAAAVVLAPSAGAKTLVGTGGSPQAVAAPDGTAHVLWEDDSSGAPVARYCRVAPGTETCAATQSWTASGTLGFQADVVRAPTGIVHVLVSIWQQGAAPFNQGAGIYDIASNAVDAADNTWAAPRRITTYTNSPPATGVGNSHQGTIYGPGTFQIGWLSTIGTPGARLTFGSTAPGPISESAVDNLVPSSYEADVGLVDAVTPLVVARDGNTGELKWRVYGGTGPVSTAANWKPQGVLPASATSSDIDLASNGVASPSLITEQQVAGTDWRVTLRRFDNANNTFTAPVTVSEDDQTHNPRVFMDSGSNVSALFLSNTKRYAGDSSTGLVYTSSATGDAWPKYGITLDQGTSNDTPVLAAGADGAGVAVWTREAGNGSSGDDAVYLGHVGGPASAFPADPPSTQPPGNQPPPPDPSCVKAPVLGVAKLLATGCFKKTTGTQLSTSAPFLVNGVTVDPKGTAVTVDTAKRTLKATGGATTLTMGPIKVGKGAVDWTFPASGTWTKPGGAIDLGAAGYGAELLGLKLTGDAKLTLKADGSSNLHGFLALPSPFTGVTAEMDFKADNFSGLRLDGLKSHIQVLGYGFHDLDLSYTSDPARWTGELHFSPSGTEGSGVDLGAKIIITNGTLDELSIDAKFPAPGRELYPPLVYLRYAGLDLKVDPLMLTGKVVVAGGPSPDEPLIAVGHPYDDFGTLKLRLSSPFSLRADGPVYVLGYKLGSGYFDYTFPGDVSFGAQAAIGSCGTSVAAVEAKVDGFVSVGSGFKMNAKGQGQVCLGKASVGATAVISSKGMAACATFGYEPFAVSAGAGLYWGDIVPDFMPLLCDTEPYEVAQGASAAQATPGGGRPVKVGAGLKQLTVVAAGDAGAPQATLVAPDGTRYPGTASGVTQTGTGWAVSEPDAKRLSFLIPKPAAGTWTLEPADGSPAIAKLQVARDAPPIKVTGKVTKTAKRGLGRTLAWKVADRAPGQTVTLYEQGSGVLRKLAVAKGAAGRVKWAPKTLRGGKRTVVAVVERDGLSVREIKLGSFTVPPPPRPGTARKLRAVHRGGALVLTWVPGANAASQEVRVTLGNGIGKLFTLKRSAKTLRVPGVAADVTGTVKVTAVRADGARGKTASAKVNKAPAKKKKATKKKR
jgi:hypothetical protein